MTHAGMPIEWALVVIVAMLALSLWAMLSPAPGVFTTRGLSLSQLPAMRTLTAVLLRNTHVLLFLKLVFAGVFILIIVAGLAGSPLAERNIATALTWNLWWTGVVIAIVFSGSAWCAVCPWDTIANWLVNRRLWRRSTSQSRLQLSVPRPLRRLWPAIALFIGFSWLELGVGIVDNPYATAVLALAMIVLAVLGLSLFEGKAFCRYACPVGRTVGVYSQLAPIALRPVDQDICNRCDTLECYHGDADIAPCPTNLVMGRIQESTYCLSCGNCTQSCPSSNISWQLRSPSAEAIQDARPHTDEAFFMLVLLALTSFHGITMLPGWETLVSNVARHFNGSSAILVSFSLGFVVSILLPIGLYALAVAGFRFHAGVSKKSIDWWRCFTGFAFLSLPLAFAYHLAHNLNHLLRESSDWGELLKNPLGLNTQPLSMAEKHQRHMTMWLSEEWLFALQAGLLILGFWVAVMVIRYRGQRLFAAHGLRLAPMVFFALAINGFNLWMLTQAMSMRM